MFLICFVSINHLFIFEKGSKALIKYLLFLKLKLTAIRMPLTTRNVKKHKTEDMTCQLPAVVLPEEGELNGGRPHHKGVKS